MTYRRQDVPHPLPQLIIPLALFVVVVGVGQIAFAVQVLKEGGTRYWFLTIMIVGMFLNMAIMFYSAIQIVGWARQHDH